MIFTGRDVTRVHDIDIEADDNRSIADSSLDLVGNPIYPIVIEVKGMDQVETSGNVIGQVFQSLL